MENELHQIGLENRQKEGTEYIYRGLGISNIIYRIYINVLQSELQKELIDSLSEDESCFFFIESMFTLQQRIEKGTHLTFMGLHTKV